MVDITLTVTYFAILLGFGVLVANVTKKIKLPDVFFLLLLGLILGPTILGNPALAQYINLSFLDVSAMGAVPDFLRLLALILIVFTGTFNLGLKAFKRLSDISISMSVLGVIFSTIVLGFAANMIFKIDLVYAFLLAAIVSGTGTEVYFAFQDVLKHSKRAINILKIESIFNSPLSILLPFIFLSLVVLEPGALIEPFQYANQFWLMIAAGVGTGIIVGFGASKLLKRTLKEYTVLMMFSIALITFALAESVGGSGILAVAIAGLIAGNYVFRERQEVQRFDDQLSKMLAISVFTLLGAQANLLMSFQEFLLVVAFFIIIVISRPFFVMPLLGKMRGSMSRGELILLSFVAPRGLAAAAMVPVASTVLISVGQPVIANQMVNIVFLVIFLTVLFGTIVAEFAGRGVKEAKVNKKLNVVEKTKIMDKQYIEKPLELKKVIEKATIAKKKSEKKK